MKTVPLITSRNLLLLPSAPDKFIGDPKGKVELTEYGNSRKIIEVHIQMYEHTLDELRKRICGK